MYFHFYPLPSNSLLYYQIVSGTEPFHYVNNMKALPIIISKGTRPLQKDHPMPDKLWNMITSCWVADKDCRPKMSKILEKLTEMVEVA